MSKPATEMRLVRAAKGFTQIIHRGDAHIITRNPSTGKCAYDGQVGGGWHYNGNNETDTAWQAGTTPWNYQMVKALYNVFALSNFKYGQILKWVDPSSGQYVTFQPMALQWTNTLNQIQQISMPQSVAAQASDDVLYWPAAYGSGRNFRYQASPLRLNKQLIIDSPSSLPATTYTLLELNFIIAFSSGVSPYIDSGNGYAAWDNKSTTDTVKAIEFRLSNGTELWSFAAPRAWDSTGNETTGSMRLKKSGSSLYVSVRFSKAWIDTVPLNNYPIVFDPTVDYQVGASADDGHWIATGFFGSGTVLAIGCASTGSIYKTFSRWTATIPNGATIDSAYISFYYSNKSGTPPACTLSFEDAANPSAISSVEDGNGRTLTTANISVTGPTSGTWWNTDSISSIISELLGSYSYASGAAMQMIIVGAGSANNYSSQKSYDYGGNTSGPKLHIEYTEAASGNPFYAYAQQ